MLGWVQQATSAHATLDCCQDQRHLQRAWCTVLHAALDASLEATRTLPICFSCSSTLFGCELRPPALCTVSRFSALTMSGATSAATT